MQLNDTSALEIEDSRLLSTRSGEIFGEVSVYALAGDQAIIGLPPGPETLSHQPKVGDLVVLAP